MKPIHSDLITPLGGVDAFFTNRQDGVSHPPYASANLAFHVGDNVADVLRNHDLLAAAIGYDRTKLVHMRQVHSDRIVRVDGASGFDAPPECDALITNLPDTPLMVMSADCTPILLYDPVARAVGAVHAGRAGTLAEILPKTIRQMGETFGSKMEDLYLSLGPSIHGCCYEINADIAAEVRHKGHAPALREENGRVFLDVNTILLRQLEAIGFPAERIEVIDACTACRNETFFSYRADRQKTGRIAGVVILRP